MNTEYPQNTYILENGGWDSRDMVQAFEVIAKDKRDLHTVERQYVEELGAELNRQVPTKTRQQYYQEENNGNRGTNGGVGRRGSWKECQLTRLLGAILRTCLLFLFH